MKDVLANPYVRNWKIRKSLTSLAASSLVGPGQKVDQWKVSDLSRLRSRHVLRLAAQGLESVSDQVAQRQSLTHTFLSAFHSDVGSTFSDLPRHQFAAPPSPTTMKGAHAAG